ncbi:4077_t:CDS:2, partial [Dentiscutata heterogama]
CSLVNQLGGLELVGNSVWRFGAACFSLRNLLLTQLSLLLNQTVSELFFGKSLRQFGAVLCYSLVNQLGGLELVGNSVLRFGAACYSSVIHFRVLDFGSLELFFGKSLRRFGLFFDKPTWWFGNSVWRFGAPKKPTTNTAFASIKSNSFFDVLELFFGNSLQSFGLRQFGA